MTRLLALLMAAVAIVLAGCASGPTKRDRELLALHPARETRMSTRTEEGYAPAGVWRVRGARNTVYIGGTAHLVTRDQFPFPSPFYGAYHDAEELYLESDLQPSFFARIRLMSKMLKWARGKMPEMLCAKGKTLEDYLEPKTSARLKGLYGKEYAKRKQFTPLGLVFLGDAESIAQQHTDEGGVEDVFIAFAHKDRKPIRTLDDDSVEDVALLVLDEMLLETKREIGQRGADAVVQERILGDKAPIKEMVWRDGDLAAIERDNEELKREAPALYERIGPERNRKWLPKVKAALQGEKNVLVLVGADHLGGETGLLKLLQEAGFVTERLYGVDSQR